MSVDTILTAILVGGCGVTIIIGLYELVSGRMPGYSTRQGQGPYRWLNTPTRVRIASLVALAIIIAYLFSTFPLSSLDLILGGIGLFIGFVVIRSDTLLHR